MDFESLWAYQTEDLKADAIATEQPGIFALADALQSALNQVQYKLDVYKSASEAYASAAGPGQAV